MAPKEGTLLAEQLRRVHPYFLKSTILHPLSVEKSALTSPHGVRPSEPTWYRYGQAMGSAGSPSACTVPYPLVVIRLSSHQTQRFTRSSA